MKNNLIFTNIIEDLKMLRPNCGNLFLKCWESNIISSLVTFIAMGRGHSPIVARFIYHTDLSMVLYNANRLKNTHIGIHQRFPNIIEQRR